MQPLGWRHSRLRLAPFVPDMSLVRLRLRSVSPWLPLLLAATLAACSDPPPPAASPRPAAAPTPAVAAARLPDATPALPRLVTDADLLTPAKIGAATRAVLGRPAHRFTVQVPPDTALAITFGVPSDAWTEALQEAEFAVTVHDDGRAQRLLKQRVARRGGKSWKHAVLSLEPFAGRRVSIALESSNIGTAGAAGVWGIPRLVPATPQHGRGRHTLPNLILISIDTLRPDHLGAYGYARNTSPVLDRLAREGVLFRNAYSTSSWTLPAHVSLFTGLLPHRHGAVRPGGTLPIGADSDTLASRLWAAGYETAGFTGGGYVSARLGFSAGFTLYTDPGVLPYWQPPFSEIVGQAQRWLQRPGSGPFFLFLHTYEVHLPYQPAPQFADLFVKPDGPFADGVTGVEILSREDPLSTDELQQLIAHYDGGIRSMDTALGTLLVLLEERGWAANTCIVLTSDHGEEFGEHGDFFHHRAKLYEELVRVPLILHCPALLPAGTVIDTPVSLVDIMPTLLDLAGLPAAPGIDGRSLLPLIAGGEWPARSLVSECDGHIAEETGTARAMRLGDRKFITSTVPTHVTEELFDLARDPGEQQNLVSDASTELAAMRTALQSALARPAAPRREARQVPTPDAATRERLRALGYSE